MVGHSETTGVSRRAVAWSAGGIQALGLPPGHVGSDASGVNDHDVVVGHSGASGVDRHAVVRFGLAAAPSLLDDQDDDLRRTELRMH